MEVFPQQLRQDSKYFSITPEDPSMKSEMEGGYTYTRARHTRKPRNKYTTGFTEIDNDAKLEIEAFYAEMHGGSEKFDWTDPTSGNVKSVRFISPPEFQYMGLNGDHYWTIQIELEEV